jgi:hypothetical protein
MLVVGCFTFIVSFLKVICKIIHHFKGINLRGLICNPLFVMCEKMAIHKLYYSHNVNIIIIFFDTLTIALQ